MESTTIALILGTGLIALCVWAVVAQARALVLCLFHNLAWAVGLLVYATGLLNYDPIAPTAWLLIGTGIVAFNLAVLVSVRHDATPIGPAMGLVSPFQFYVLVVLFFLGWSVYLVVIIQNFGLQVFISDPSSIRGSEEGYLSRVPLWARLLIFLGPLVMQLSLFKVWVRGRVPTLVRAVVFAGTIIALASLLQRSNLFFALLWAVAHVVISRLAFGKLTLHRADAQPGAAATRSSRGRSIAALVLLAALSLGVYQGIAVALGKTGSTNPAVTLAVDERVEDSEFLGMMVYSSSGIAAFSKLVESSNDDYPPERAEGQNIYGNYNPQLWGLATFNDVAKLLPLEKQWNSIAPFVYTPIPTNVFTWLEFWYRDFRWFGVLLGSVSVGLVISLLYRRALAGSPAPAILLPLFVGHTALATFANQTLSTSTVFVVFVVLIVGWAGGRRRTDSAEALSISPST